MRRSLVHPSTQAGSPLSPHQAAQSCALLGIRKHPGWSQHSFPGSTHPCPAVPKGKGSHFLSNLSTFSFYPQFLSTPAFTSWFNSLFAFPQVLRAVCRHCQSSARMSHCSLTASSHRTSAPNLWRSCGSSTELTSKLDAVLRTHPAEMRGIITSISLLGLALTIQDFFWHFCCQVSAHCPPGPWVPFLQGFSLGSVSPSWIALRAEHVCTCIISYPLVL